MVVMMIRIITRILAGCLSSIAYDDDDCMLRMIRITFLMMMMMSTIVMMRRTMMLMTIFICQLASWTSWIAEEKQMLQFNATSFKLFA